MSAQAHSWVGDGVQVSPKQPTSIGAAGGRLGVQLSSNHSMSGSSWESVSSSQRRKGELSFVPRNITPLVVSYTPEYSGSYFAIFRAYGPRISKSVERELAATNLFHDDASQIVSNEQYRSLWTVLSNIGQPFQEIPCISRDITSCRPVAAVAIGETSGFSYGVNDPRNYVEVFHSRIV